MLKSMYFYFLRVTVTWNIFSTITEGFDAWQTYVPASVKVTLSIVSCGSETRYNNSRAFRTGAVLLKLDWNISMLWSFEWYTYKMYHLNLCGIRQVKGHHLSLSL